MRNCNPKRPHGGRGHRGPASLSPGEAGGTSAREAVRKCLRQTRRVRYQTREAQEMG